MATFRMTFFRNSLKYFIFIGCLMFVIPYSCSRYEYAEFGFYPKYIRGKVHPEVKNLDDSLLVIIVEKNKTFMSFKEKGNIYGQTIKVLNGYKNGTYIYNWSSSAESVVIYFYLQNRTTNQYIFNAGMGIGGFEYDPELAIDENWEDNYLFNIKPQLSGFIDQPRLRLSEIDQGIISDWMAQVENNIRHNKNTTP